MTLETLAKDIAASAQADAKAIIDQAKAEAKQITDEAKDKASSITDEAVARAEREANQISKEVVASVLDKLIKKRFLSLSVKLWIVLMLQLKNNSLTQVSRVVLAC